MVKMVKSLNKADYSELTKDQKIDKFLEAIGTAFARMDATTFWPASAAQIDASFCDILATFIFEKFKED